MLSGCYFDSNNLTLDKIIIILLEMPLKTKNIASLFLAFLILWGTAGLTVYRHFCAAEANVNTSVQADKPCCCSSESKGSCTMPEKEKKPGHEKKDDCCKTEKQTLNPEFISVKKAEINWKFSAIIPVFFHFTAEKTHPFIGEEITYYSDSSPPLSGKNLIIRKQAFLL